MNEIQQDALDHVHSSTQGVRLTSWSSHILCWWSQLCDSQFVVFLPGLLPLFSPFPFVSFLSFLLYVYFETINPFLVKSGLLLLLESCVLFFLDCPYFYYHATFLFNSSFAWIFWKWLKAWSKLPSWVALLWLPWVLQ